MFCVDTFVVCKNFNFDEIDDNDVFFSKCFYAKFLFSNTKIDEFSLRYETLSKKISSNEINLIFDQQMRSSNCQTIDYCIHRFLNRTNLRLIRLKFALFRIVD